MRKYRVAFVTGVLVGLTAVLALLTGGDIWFVTLLVCSSTILTAVGPPVDDPEALRENWHFSLAIVLAAVGIAMAAVLARGPLFGTVRVIDRSSAGADLPIWLRVALSGGWFAVTGYRARKAWHKSATV